ncbi:MAG: LysM peptidoglycan-binding domain-containing protein [Alphaproteobacteria bacterium]|nr:LysM peptidoglycan-binding domain-containing protein [Alphaproteobacteria bacterium]
MSERGTHEHLIIQAFDKADYSGEPIDVFVVPFNPAELTMSSAVEYDSGGGSGTTNSRQTFKRIKPGDLSLTLTIDGTGASGEKRDVQDEIAHFNDVTGYNGDIHRPNYLKVVWGTLPVKRCVLKSASVVYKLFRSDGVPLRAVITASFSDNSDDKTRVAQARDESPDLTHLHQVRAGEDLPMLCQRYYGDPGYYLKVARANDLLNFRRLKPGTRLRFPPLEK